MRYTLSINQVKCQEWSLNLAQGALFDLLNQASSWAKPHVVDGEVYYWVSRNKILEEIPFAYSKSDTVYRALKTLNQKGLIEHIKEGKKDLIRLTELGKTWNVKGTSVGDAKLGNKSDLENNSEINPSKVGNKSEKTPKNSEINPTYKSTNYNNTKDKKREGVTSNSRTKFLKPTITEIKDYFIERECTDSFEESSKFYDFYESKGWKVGKSPMKDWRAAVRNWLRRNKSDASKAASNQRFNIDNEDWSQSNSDNSGYHPSHSTSQPTANQKSKYNPVTDAVIAGMIVPPLPNMTPQNTMTHVAQNVKPGETSDETYRRLMNEMQGEDV